MGQTCGCADKDDREQEVRADPVSLVRELTLGSDRWGDEWLWELSMLAQETLLMPSMLSKLPLSITFTVSLLWNSLKVLIMPSWDLSVSTMIAQSECSLTIVALCRKNSAETTSTTVTVVCRMERRRHRAWPALLSTTSPATSCSPVLRQWPRSLVYNSSMNSSLKMVRSIAVSLSFVWLSGLVCDILELWNAVSRILLLLNCPMALLLHKDQSRCGRECLSIQCGCSSDHC